MLTYTLDSTKNIALYEQLYQNIKNDIENEILSSNEKLPSKRNFAKNLGVSTITIENAYEQLLSEGYIYSLPKKGYYVSSLSKSFFNRISSPSNSAAGFTEANLLSLRSSEDFYADFSSNQTRPENFPFYIWSKLMKETLRDHDPALMIKPPCGGIPELRIAIASYLRQFRGMEVLPEQIFIGAGTEYLYGLLVQLLGLDKIYATENPGYSKISQIYKSHHVLCRFIDMDLRGIQMEQLKNSDAQIVHLSPSHHFPTGIITPIGKRYELLDWVDMNSDRYIIEDDYDSEFRMVGKPIPALQSIDKNEKVIYINTFSKSLTSTMRISYMVLPPHLADRFNKEMSFYSCTVSNFEQYTLARFINEGYLEKHMNRMRNYYHKQRDILLNAIKKSPLSSHVTITEEDSGLHFLMKINTNISDSELIEKARKHHIKLSCLEEYYQSPPKFANHVFIINYSFLQKDHLQDALHTIYRIAFEKSD